METTINIPFKDSHSVDELRKFSLSELKEAFERKNKITNRKASFKEHVIYYETTHYYRVAKEGEQKKDLLDIIGDFEKYLNYDINPVNSSPDDSCSGIDQRWYLKGKFTDEKQFYIYFLTR